MKDYRKYLGYEVAVMTSSGTFHGVLREVGALTLSLKVKSWYSSDGQPQGSMDGLLMLDRLAIQFVQVK